MIELYHALIGSGTLHVVVTDRVDGDQRPDIDTSRAALAARRDRQRALTGSEWSMAAEEHGTGVVDIDVATGSSLPPGDVLVTTKANRALAVWAGDCAPLVLYGPSGTLVAVHAGWRGLAAGIVDVAVGELTARDDRAIVAVLGPCIHSECYAFGDRELESVARGVGAPVDRITGSTSDGRVALDVPAAVAAALATWGIGLDVIGPCTSCDLRWFSHRARSESERHALVAWTTPAEATR